MRGTQAVVVKKLNRTLKSFLYEILRPHAAFLFRPWIFPCRSVKCSFSLRFSSSSHHCKKFSTHLRSGRRSTQFVNSVNVRWNFTGWFPLSHFLAGCRPLCRVQLTYSNCLCMRIYPLLSFVSWFTAKLEITADETISDLIGQRQKWWLCFSMLLAALWRQTPTDRPHS